MTDALDGLRVIDGTTGIAGPIAAMFLADFGADVVKVEPDGGDPTRSDPGYAVWNRGKRIVSSSGAAALVEGADLVITNAATHFDVDEERSVHLVMPPFLDAAPWCDARESEGLLAATTGVSLRQSSFTEGPVDAVFPILPTVQGIWGAAVALAALRARDQSGRGQRVLVGGMHGVMVASAAALTFDPTAPAAARVGNAGGSVPFYRTYQCKDGEWLFLAALTPRFTDLAFKALGLTDLYEDTRLGGRGRAGMLHPDNSPWVSQRIADVFLSDTRDEWLAQLAAVGCPAGAVLERDAWLDHPQLEAIGMRVEVDDPDRGKVVMPGVPVKAERTPGAVRGPAPATPAADSATSWQAAGWGDRPATRDATSEGGPLAGLRVLDLGAIIAGPFAGSLLADLGADVVKVEPMTGDSFRGPGFAAYNKGQRGVAIDLQQPRGRAALLALAKDADVVIDNYRPGVLQRLDIEWRALHEINPGIVSISITGFGDGGPLGGEAGFDPVLQAMSGMMRSQGGDAEPVFFTVPVNDVATAAATAFGALVGVLHGDRTGEGQKVTTSLAAMSAFLQAGEIVRYDGRPRARVGSRDHRGATALTRYYEAADGWLRIDAPSTTDLRSLGIDNADAGAIAEWVATRSRADAVTRLNAAGVPAASARSARELADDSAVLAAGVLRHDPRPGREHLWTAGRHARFSRSTYDADLVAPALGEHTIEVLAAAGYTTAEIDDLVAAGIVAVAPPPSS